MIYVYTSILNGFDNLRPPSCEIPHNVRFICFTNVPNLPRVTPWEYRPAYVGNGKSSGWNSRIPKILPHLMLPRDAEYSIYHDGNFILKADPNVVIDLAAGQAQWAAFKHPGRACVYEEAKTVLRDCPLTDKEAVERQVARYRAAGFQEGAGLWANGFIVRRHTEKIAKFNESWWAEFRDSCERDQLSFPFVRAAAGLRVHTIDQDIFHSPLIQHRWHAPWKSQEDNPDYWEERAEIRNRLNTLRTITGTTGGIEYGVTKDAAGKPFEF